MDRIGIFGSLTFEDLTVSFTETDGRYYVILKDDITRRERAISLSHQEMGAVMHLLFGPPTGRLEEMLYEVAEPATEGLPDELRPIP